MKRKINTFFSDAYRRLRLPAVMRLLAFLLFISICPGSMYQEILAADVEDIDKLGPITHYNGVVFGDFTSERADVEGALAIGGEYAEFGTQDWYGYDIGAAGYMPDASNILGFYNNPKGYPSLLLNTEQMSIGAARGKVVNGDNWYGVYGGRIIIPENMYSAYRQLEPQFNGGHKSWATAADLPLTADEAVLDEWFDSQRKLAEAATRQYAEATSISIDLDEFSDGSYLNTDPSYYKNQKLKEKGQAQPDENILVINVRSGVQLDFSDPECLMPVSAQWAVDYDLVIYNFPDAEHVTAQDGSYSAHIKGFPAGQVNQPYRLLSEANKKMRLALCCNVIWNFPKAETITFTEFQLYGSVLAPYADFEGNGSSLNGQLICNNFMQKGGFELHAYPLDERAFEVVDPDPEPHVSDGELCIEKTLTEEAEQDEQFIFKITKGNQVYYGMIEIAEGEKQSSIRFVKLDYGAYTIEECDTNWRYKPEGDSSIREVRLSEAEKEGTVGFVNVKECENWLGGHRRVTNKMKALSGEGAGR